jgi:hypothetical protein
VIYCEVLQGIRDDAVYAKVREILQAFPVLLLDGLRLIEPPPSIEPVVEEGSRFAVRLIV